MKVDKYEMGKWIKEYVDLPWEDDADESRFLENNGFSTYSYVLKSDTCQFRLFQHESNSSFLVDVDFDFEETIFYYVLIENVPSLLMFFKEFNLKRKIEQPRFIRINGYIINIDQIGHAITNNMIKEKAAFTIFDKDGEVLRELRGYDACWAYEYIKPFISEV